MTAVAVNGARGEAAGAIDIGALKERNPIEDVVARRGGIELRPAGGALVGRCPFHADRGRPNLYVYVATQSWYCYRCAIGGDVIDFLRRLEDLDFAAACERLTRDGLASPRGQARIPRPASLQEARRWDRRTLEEQVVMNTAAALYRHTLWRTPGALAYLRGRGLPDWLIRTCGLGYSDGHSLEAFLRRRSGLRVAQDLGLLRKPERTDDGRPLREALAGRVVVPELRGGNAVWFIGRLPEDDPGRPKYLALSGERPILGFERAVGQREVFLCEGVFDYLTAVSWRLPAFSPCGTHLPAQRLGFLARTEIVYGVLDADDAGQEAAARFSERLGQRWWPLALPVGAKDLSALGARPDGRACFFELLTGARAKRRQRPTDAPAQMNHGEEVAHARAR